jgi:Zn-dependent peptidase ImmA (M78 family)
MEIPYLDDEKIKKIADSFRVKFSDNSIPVEMEEIIELRLKMYIALSPGLKYLQGIDMIIMSNFKSIYVDENIYSDETQKNRLRFSYAHEIGHFVLHKDIYKKFGIKDWKNFYNIQKKNLIKKTLKELTNKLIFLRDIFLCQKIDWKLKKIKY